MTDKKTKNDESWEKLFNKYDILNGIRNEGIFSITSEQINEFREARLMTKFDYRSNLPTIFRKNNLAILPVTRGNYVISHFDAYQSLELGEDIILMDFPDHIQSLSYENITSEAAAINCAYLSGILSDFVEDTQLQPTVNGRMSSDSFNFKIKNIETGEFIEIGVENSQLEIDAGYEGIDFLTLVEAKNSISDDFLVRQVYYPYRLWLNKVKKTVKPVFMVYTNGVFHLYEYKFVEPDNYSSLVLVKQQSYSIEPRDIEINDIQTVLCSVEIIAEPKISFPQANSFDRIVNLCEILNDQTELTKSEITSKYDFNVRQTEYYTDAGRYLGLVEKKGKGDSAKFFLTGKGKSLFKLKYKSRQLKIVEAILKHDPFFQSLKLYLGTYVIPTKQEIVEIMKKSEIYKVKSDITFGRRASTVLAWLDWILELTK